PRRIDEMLASDDDTAREQAIGHALAAKPPLVDRLLRAARDSATPGSLRCTALLAAVEAAADDPDVAAAVLDLSAGADRGVRRTAIELLARLGGRGADRAAALLRSGDFDEPLRGPLCRAVAAGPGALEFLLTAPSVEIAFAVLDAVGSAPA